MCCDLKVELLSVSAVKMSIVSPVLKPLVQRRVRIFPSVALDVTDLDSSGREDGVNDTEERRN